MNKYIPTDKLIATLERQNVDKKVIQTLIRIIDSLQQEQPEKGLDVTEFCEPINPGIAKCIADHWWEMLDDKNAEEKQPEVDLEKEIDRVFFQKGCGSDRLHHKEIASIARHFAEWGATHLKR